MDYVRRFLFERLDIRGAIVALGNAWHEMHAGRDDPPAVTALLGELTAVTALLAGNLKTPGRLTFQLQGHGIVSLLLVDCNEQLRMRGTVRLKADAAVPPAPTFVPASRAHRAHEPAPKPEQTATGLAVPPAPTFVPASRAHRAHEPAPKPEQTATGLAVPPAPTFVPASRAHRAHEPAPKPEQTAAGFAVPPAPTFYELLGDGQLVLTLQTGFGDPYQSIVPLTGDSLTEVFEHYLVQSEQQPARLFLTATDDFAGGLFLQKLPDADARDADGWNRISHLAATLRPAELAEPVAGLLMRAFPEEDIRLFDPRPVRYHCPRDEEKVLAMLKNLGRDELAAALAEQGEIAIVDDICRQHYRYGPDILGRLFD